MRVGALHRPARLQSSHDRQPPRCWHWSAALLVFRDQLVGAQWNRYVEGAPNLHAKKSRRSDADHRESVTIQTDCSANHLSVPAKLALPESIAEHGARVGADRAIIFC